MQQKPITIKPVALLNYNCNCIPFLHKKPYFCNTFTICHGLKIWIRLISVSVLHFLKCIVFHNTWMLLSRKLSKSEILELLINSQIFSKVKSVARNRRAFMLWCMNVDEARGACKDRSRWRSSFSAYPRGQKAWVYVCMIKFVTIIFILFIYLKGSPTIINTKDIT